MTPNNRRKNSRVSRGDVLHSVTSIDDKCTGKVLLKLKEWFVAGLIRVQTSEDDMTRGSAQPKREGEKMPRIVNPPLKAQLQINYNHDYGFNRGVSRETLEEFGAGYCVSAGIYAGRFIIPLHNETGELVGYVGRAVDASEPKYLFPSNEDGFNKSNLLFNLHRVLNSKWHKRDEVRGRIMTPIILVEGFFGAMKLHTLNYSCLSLMGSSLSEQQETLLHTHFNHAVCLFNGDEGGRNCTNECLLRLGRHMWVTTMDVGSGRRPDQFAEEDLRELLYS